MMARATIVALLAFMWQSVQSAEPTGNTEVTSMLKAVECAVDEHLRETLRVPTHDVVFPSGLRRYLASEELLGGNGWPLFQYQFVDGYHETTWVIRSFWQDSITTAERRIRMLLLMGKLNFSAVSHDAKKHVYKAVRLHGECQELIELKADSQPFVITWVVRYKDNDKPGKPCTFLQLTSALPWCLSAQHRYETIGKLSFDPVMDLNVNRLTLTGSEKSGIDVSFEIDLPAKAQNLVSAQRTHILESGYKKSGKENRFTKDIDDSHHFVELLNNEARGTLTMRVQTYPNFR